MSDRDDDGAPAAWADPFNEFKPRKGFAYQWVAVGPSRCLRARPESMTEMAALEFIEDANLNVERKR